jgi:hypothetical protein
MASDARRVREIKLKIAIRQEEDIFNQQNLTYI